MDILNCGYLLNVCNFNVLMHKLCEESKLKEAQLVFDEVEKWGLLPIVVSSNTLIIGYGKFGDLEVWFRLKKVMEESGMCSKVFTYSVMIKGVLKLFHKGNVRKRVEFTWISKRDIGWNGINIPKLRNFGSNVEEELGDSTSKNAFKHILTCLFKPGGGQIRQFFSLPSLNNLRIDNLTYSIKIFLEFAIHNCNSFQVIKDDVERIIDWENSSLKQVEIPFKPTCILL